MIISRFVAGVLSAIIATSSCALAVPHTWSSVRAQISSAAPEVVQRFTTPDGKAVTVYANGLETLADAKGKITRRALAPLDTSQIDPEDAESMHDELVKPLLLPAKPNRPYKPNELVVVFAPGGAPQSDNVRVTASVRTAAQYSNNYFANKAFARLGVDSLARVASKVDRGTLSRMRQSSGGALRAPVLDLGSTFVVHFTNAPMKTALEELRKTPGIAYVSPNFYVSTMHTTPLGFSARAMEQSRSRAMLRATHPLERSKVSFAPHSIPTNYAVSTGAQSFLDASSLNVVTAYDLIQQTFNQLPGQGERIANISIGDVDDSVNTNDPCYQFALSFGQTTHLINGQHYIDWPSMPLIPAYVVDANGIASGTNSACLADPTLDEVGLDFSMMAPLPRDMQRPGATGSGYSDLLGIAPGAKYSLYVPQTMDGNVTTTSIVATMLAAAQAPPDVRPTVITASLGFGADGYGFPGRFFEEDPIVGSAVSSIVNGQNIVVCISANDGTRMFTPAAIGPAGGSAATNVIPTTATPTNLNDVFLTTIPSQVYDYGAIDVGGSTLNDTLAAAPEDPAFASTKNQLAWPEVRWSGFGGFSSGFGTRVNLSAPSDNVLAMSHTLYSNDYNKISMGLNGGTSASAPEVAAAAAVLLQVGRLTGHPFANPMAVRQFLIQTARPLPNIPQADQTINVGPQIDLGNAVSTLLAQAGKHIALAAPRVSITQRQERSKKGGAFVTDTLPWQIDLQTGTGWSVKSDVGEIEPITISPDWEGVTPDTTFKLTLANKPNVVLATTRFARLMPADILGAAGLPLVAAGLRSVQLEYTARSGLRDAAISFSLTFGPADPTIDGGSAPHVDPVVRGNTMTVAYDISRARNVLNPAVVISEPGRVLPGGFPAFFHPSYSVPITQLTGTVQIPVSSLQGAGVYGIAVKYSEAPAYYRGPMAPKYTHFAFTRVEQGSAVRANPVQISTDNGVTYSHFATANYGAPYSVKWDVSNVPGANGALLEIGPSAPSLWSSYNTFNNPNGSIADNNGVDSASVYTQMLSGTSGTVALSTSTLIPTLLNQVRVIPMNGSSPAGEASDASIAWTTGFTPPDGNPIISFTTGNNGKAEVTTFLGTPAIVYSNGLFSFDMKTGVMGNNLGNPNGGWGIYNFIYPRGTVSAGGYQIMENTILPSVGANGLTKAGYPQWGVMNVSPASLGQFSPLPAGLDIYSVAYNRSTDSELVAFKNWATQKYYMTTASLPGLTLGAQYDVTQAFMPPVSVPGTSPVSYDPGLNIGIVESGSSNTVWEDSCRSATSTHKLWTVSLVTGALQSFPGAGHGFDTTAYDSARHVLASADRCGNLTFYNVQTGGARTIQLPGAYYPDMLSVDAKNGLVLVGDMIDPAWQSNNDVQSAILVYDENGNLLKTLYGTNFFGNLPMYMELNENTREVLVSDFSGTMIEPLYY